MLVGPGTYRLIHDVARTGPVRSLSVHGKSMAVQAWRLVDVDDEARYVRRVGATPLLGRDRELTLLRQTFERCVDERACHLVTLLGIAGVGKTRLLSELLSSLPGDATVLRGRCLSYGDAVGLWPVREMLRSAAELSHTDDDADARGRLARLLSDEPEAAVLVDRLAPLAGLHGVLPSREEANWAVRRFLEVLGRDAPLVAVVDDVHRADPAMLDLLDHLADWVRDTPLLLVCVSRPELLDTRPSWGGGRVNATSLLLSPLNEVTADNLIQALAGGAQVAPEVAQQIRAAAAGVPLYAEHLFAMLVEEGHVALVDGTYASVGTSRVIDIPPTIAAILGARLDHLEPTQRAVLEAASVVGEVFYRGAVSELAQTMTARELDGALSTLVRRDLVRPEASDLAGEEAMRFTHVLVRDAAYHSISKTRRAVRQSSGSRDSGRSDGSQRCCRCSAACACSRVMPQKPRSVRTGLATSRRRRTSSRRRSGARCAQCSKRATGG